jgi:hypothetical protein
MRSSRCLSALAVAAVACPCLCFQSCNAPVLARRAAPHSRNARVRQPSAAPLKMAAGDNEKKNGEEDKGFSIPNPFMDTFKAGRNLRETIDDALDQFTGSKSSKVCIQRWSHSTLHALMTQLCLIAAIARSRDEALFPSDVSCMGWVLHAACS